MVGSAVPVRRGGAGGRRGGRGRTTAGAGDGRHSWSAPGPARRPADGRAAAGMAARARPRGRGLRGAGARHPRLRGQERLHRRGDRAVRRDRLLAGGGHRRRRPRARPRARGDHALALLERGLGGRRGDPGRQPGHRPGHRGHRGRPPGPGRVAGPAARRRARRADRREPAVADPGRAAHGPVQRQRVDRAHHRQQERDGHRLLDPLRRLGRRVRGDQGRAQDPGLRLVPLPQPAGRLRPHPRAGADQGAVGRAAARPAGRRVAAALRGPRPGGGRLRRGRPVAPTTWSPTGFDPEAVDRVVGLVDRAEYKRRQMPPGVRISGKAFGKDRRMPITNHYRSIGRRRRRRAPATATRRRPAAVVRRRRRPRPGPTVRPGGA